MQTFNILGTHMTFRTTRECSSLSDCFLNNGIMNTALYVSSRMLLAAAKDEKRKTYLESMDMTLYSEGDILRIGNIDTKSRVSDVENLRYLRDFLSKIGRTEKGVFLLSETAETLSSLTKLLHSYCPKLSIVGTLSLDSVPNHPDNLSNHINASTPIVIISNLPSPLQEELMFEMKPYLNAEMWLGLSDNITIRKPHHYFRQIIYRCYLKNFQKQSHPSK